jgi:4a-hydroxytetrahydrobiopterin dehydratase
MLNGNQKGRKFFKGCKLIQHRKALEMTYKLKDFVSAIRLIQKIAVIAERMDHHPDLHLTRYRRLRVVTTTHSAGKVTAKDYRLAAAIDRLFKTVR